MQFRLLGTLEVSDDGATIEIPSGKCRAALTVLLLRANRRVSADELVEALWGERAPARAKNAVQVHVSTLRKSLGPDRIDSDSSGYRLRVDAGELDIERFEDLARGGANALARGEHNDAVTLLNQALSWWRGPALGGAVAAEFAAPHAARLEERHEVAIEDRVEALLALGRHANLVPELEQHHRQPANRRPVHAFRDASHLEHLWPRGSRGSRRGGRSGRRPRRRRCRRHRWRARASRSARHPRSGRSGRSGRSRRRVWHGATTRSAALLVQPS